ncbi:hypothetical protein [Delftia tsuruhatensis]|uniref:hypothetical protein n=1 Tax=Delftia tsuruhatensis TaxID=180282 RepID=UPI00209020BA|nr:hypothetical protein [Delftia tsuruhatensis]MCO5339274.1 hypothetical protein [Delftia tsuruhatensis]MCR4546889.1 hypothetical protein [Delftia tsuruhatensis]
MTITAINVFIEMDGKQCIAFINPEMAEVFVGMLPAMQTGQPKHAVLRPLPPSVAEPLQQTRAALYEHLMAARNAKAPSAPMPSGRRHQK